MEKKIRVKFQGGREGLSSCSLIRAARPIHPFVWIHSVVVFVATGILKGYDPLLNLVLDGCSEHIQGSHKFPITVHMGCYV